jgi:ketosteroid isomerase-like protein
LKAEEMKLSADEKMLIDGLKASLDKKPTESFFEPLIKKYPSDYYLQLWIMFNNNDRIRAIEIGENIVKHKPKFAPVYNLLGYYYMDENNMAKAEANFNKYMALRPNLHNVYDSKGDFMMRIGKIEEAIPLYEKAASMGMSASAAKAESARARIKFPAPSDEEATSMKNMILASLEAVKKSDVDAALENFSEHSVEIFANQRVNVGLPNLRKRVSNMFKNGSFTKEDYTIKGINGAGPIAVAYGNNDFIWKESASGKETERRENAIFMLRKQSDGDWQILATHFYGPDGETAPISSDDRASINELLSRWNKFATKDEATTEKNLDALSSLYSQQAIEIFPGQISNVGIANLRARWDLFLGFTMETNSLGALGIEGLGRRAVAWGIASQNFYPKDSQELQKHQFPWAMILTKEKDDIWRILAFHWGAD